MQASIANLFGGNVRRVLLNSGKKFIGVKPITKGLCNAKLPTSAFTDDVFQLTESAATRLSSVADAEEYLRVLVESGGCSGFEYKFELTKDVDPEEDLIFAKDGARVVVDQVSLDLIKGSTLDYANELIRAGFFIAANPNADQGCSCGVSFSLKM